MYELSNFFFNCYVKKTDIYGDEIYEPVQFCED